MKCSRCSNPIGLDGAKSWEGFTSCPVVCDNCETINWARMKRADETIILGIQPPKESLPPLVEETWIFIINREHTRYLEPGVVIRRSHAHYRVKFNDGTIIWMPEHWI